MTPRPRLSSRAAAPPAPSHPSHSTGLRPRASEAAMAMPPATESIAKTSSTPRTRPKVPRSPRMPSRAACAPRACPSRVADIGASHHAHTRRAGLQAGRPEDLVESGHLLTMSTTAPDERPRVLIVDDEKFIRDILADFLGMEGYIVRTAEDGAAALNELHNAHYDLVISDLKMPRMGGIELLDAIGTAAPNALTVIMTGFGTVETAIDAMKRGAYDYILKPFKVEEVIRVVQRGLEKQRLAAENLRLREALSLYKVSEAIAASLSLDEVLATIGDTGLHEIDGDLVSTWLDDGEGGFFERQRLVQPRKDNDDRERVGFGDFDPKAFIEHFAADPT